MQGGLTFAGLREPASLPAERSALPLSSVPPFSAMTANGGGWLPQGSSGAQLPAEEQLCDLTNLRRFGGSRGDSAETSSCWVPKMHELQPFWKSVCQYLGKLTAFAVCSQVCAVLSHFSHVPLFVTLWTAACQAPLPMGILQARYQSGLPCPPPGDLFDPRIEPLSLMSPALAGRFFTTRATWDAPRYTPTK